MIPSHTQPLAIAAMVLAFVSTSGRARAAEPSLRPLDFSPTAVSADGTVVVGTRRTTAAPESTSQAVRWTAAGGAAPLGTLPGQAGSRAWDVSADGAVVVGTSYASNGSQPKPFRWDADEGMVGLGQPGHSFGEAHGVSADGSVVVGMGGGQAFRWTAAGGMASFGDLDGSATDVSSDGSVVVGGGSWLRGLAPDDANNPPAPFRRDVLRWTGDGETVLWRGMNAGEGYPRLSGEGAVVVGSSSGQAVRWTADGGTARLGVLSPDHISYAGGVSADGSVVVGTSLHIIGDECLYNPWCLDPFLDYDSTPFIWDQSHGMQSLEDVLLDLGLDVTGWRDAKATAVSADGLTIVGTRTDPSGQAQGWIATIPEPGFIAPAAVALGGLLARRRRTSAVC